LLFFVESTDIKQQSIENVAEFLDDAVDILDASILHEIKDLKTAYNQRPKNLKMTKIFKLQLYSKYN
jgi:hypothetical protein